MAVRREVWVNHLNDTWFALFQEPVPLQPYMNRLRYLVSTLEELLFDDVRLCVHSEKRIAEIGTSHAVIAKITVFPAGLGVSKTTRVLIRLNPAYKQHRVWFEAAFAGLRQTYRELVFELTKGMEAPRDR
jgi:hypothetical protein